MSGLASKWAVDEELVNEAKIQDSESRKHTSQVRKTPTVTNGKPKPLESKWADDSGEPSATTTNKSKKADEISGYTSYKKNRGKEDFKSRRKSHGSLPSPPSTAEKDEHPERRYDNTRNSSGNSPRKSCSSRDNSKKQRGHHVNRSIEENDGSDEEQTVPMSKAGASFAARLGVAPKTSSKTNNNDDDQFETTDEDVTDEDAHADSDDYEDVDESEDEEEELPPMSSAGQSLASRLGMASITPQPPRTKQPTKQPKQKKQELITSNQQKAPKGAYLTPKQKREEQAKKDREEKERLQKLKDEKLKEEVQDMFSKLTNSSANWADLEDED